MLLLGRMLRQDGANGDTGFAVRAGCPDAAAMDAIVTLDQGTEAEHTQATNASAWNGRCVQNGHIAPTPQPMSPYRLALCLLTIGWSERELVRRSGEHRNTVRRWLAGDSAIDTEIATWLEILTAVHLANPGPRRRKRARAGKHRETPAPRSRRTQIETVRELERPV